MHRTLWALLPLALVGCTEYEFVHPTPPVDVADDPVTSCGDLDVGPGTDITVDESCLVEPQVGAFTPIIKARNTAIGDAYTTPLVGQLTDDNGDGLVNGSDMPDIVVATTVGTLYVLSNDLQTIKWQANAMGGEPATPAIGDVNGDHRPDVVAAGSGGVAAYDGATGATLWSIAGVPGAAKLPICGGVGLYDLDHDGNAEVVIGHSILDGRTGALRGAGSYGEGTGHPWAATFGAAADIDGDGNLEVVTGNAIYDANGVAKWYNGLSDGFVAVANFDSDPQGEIVVTSYAGNGAPPSYIRLQDSDGSVIWQKLFDSATVGPPTVADFDGDGQPEIGVAGNNVYAVFETNGDLKWSRPTTDWSSGFTGSSVFDFEGDGAAEVVYADENDVWVYDGATGAVKMQEQSHSSATCSEYPSIADVDKDGHAEIIYTSSAYSGTETGVTIIGDAGNSWMAGRPVWNQHTYAITNVSPDSSIPADAEPNWPSFNNWRSGDVTPMTGSSEGDAVALEGDICAECGADNIVTVVARVGNAGMDTLPAGTPIAVYAMQGGVPVLVDSRVTDQALAPGAVTAGIRFDLPVGELTDNAVRIVVDDNGSGVGSVAECHEDNNVLELANLCSN